MPQTRHIEHHFEASDTIRDIIIGMSDGLTVPFALAAGLSSANAATVVVVTAGLAEIAAGSVSMGLGGYLAARNDEDHYAAERRREEQEVIDKPQAERQEVREVFLSYGLTEAHSREITESLAARPEAWVDFMMRFELGLEEPEPRRALISALTIAGSYVVGGFIPLSPYILLADIQIAQIASVVTTLTALLVFGYIKGRLTGTYPLRSALQTMLVGGVAAFVAFAIAKLVS